jgi:hypothetical protein
LQPEEKKSNSPKECKSLANRVHCSFGAYEEEPPAKADPNRPPSPVCEMLGTITYLCNGGRHTRHTALQSPSGEIETYDCEGGRHTALQSPSGEIEFEGMRYKSIRDWLRQKFLKKL